MGFCMDFYRCHGFLQNFYVYGFLWVSMGFLRIFYGFYGSLRISMGFLRISVDSMDFYVFLENFYGFLFLENFKGFYGFVTVSEKHRFLRFFFPVSGEFRYGFVKVLDRFDVVVSMPWPTFHGDTR